MSRIRIETGGRAPAEVEQCLQKAVRAIDLSQDTDFADPVMQSSYIENLDLFTEIFEAMAEDIEAAQ